MSSYWRKTCVLIYTTSSNFPHRVLFLKITFTIFSTRSSFHLKSWRIKSKKISSWFWTTLLCLPWASEEHLKTQCPPSGFIHDFSFELKNPWAVFPHFPSINSLFSFLTFSSLSWHSLACDIYIVLSCKWISSGPWMVWELHYTSRWLSL